MADEHRDAFRMADDMRRNGWKIVWRFIPRGELGAGCVEIEVSLDGSKGKAVAEKFGIALDRAIKRRDRDIARSSEVGDDDTEIS